MSPSEPIGPLPLPARSAEEALAAFDSVPLFMKSLPEDGLGDAAMDALQSLVYEGTSDGTPAQQYSTLFIV